MLEFALPLYRMLSRLLALCFCVIFACMVSWYASSMFYEELVPGMLGDFDSTMPRLVLTFSFCFPAVKLAAPPIPNLSFSTTHTNIDLALDELTA